MPKFIRFRNPDGTTSECHPIPNARLVRIVVPLFELSRDPNPPLPPGAEFAESEEEFLLRIFAKDIPPGADGVEIVEA